MRATFVVPGVAGRVHRRQEGGKPDRRRRNRTGYGADAASHSSRVGSCSTAARLRPHAAQNTPDPGGSPQNGQTRAPGSMTRWCQSGYPPRVELQPRLIEVQVPERPEGVVVVLHGGGARRVRMMVSPTQLSVLRMIPVARRVARAGRGRLAVFRLLNSVRGWDAHHTPVRDAEWALDGIAERLGDDEADVPRRAFARRAGGAAGGGPA